MQKRELLIMKKEGISKNNKIWLIIVFIFILLLAILYFSITFYFNTHFYFGSIINGVDYTGKTVAQVEQLMSQEISEYTLELIGRDNLIDTITSSDINYRFVSDGKIEQLKASQNPFAWVIALFSNPTNNEMMATTTFDETLLKERFNNLVFFKKEHIIKPQSAYVKYNKKNGYILVDEQNGSKVVKENLYKTVTHALQKSISSINLQTENCYQQPKYTTTSKELVQFYNKIKKYTDVVILYQFGDIAETVDHTLIHNWLTLDNDNLKVSFDETKVRTFIDYLGYHYNTFGKTRTFKASTKKNATVSGGDYGWLLNRPEEVKSLIKTIKKGKSITKEPVYIQKAASYDKNDFGDTYVEINLTKQHLWFYKEGDLVVESDFVSGNVRDNHATPLGTYSITYKESPSILSGSNYNSKVTFWMPFNGNVGMHDASWRSKFGKNIYKTSGSHGCINLPYKEAKIIYQNISAGIPVLCYEE